MQLHQLRYFLAVARLSNFSRAAEECRVAQPSLSQQIQKLEEELGERLFERTKRDVALTPAGEILRTHAQRVLEEVELAQATFRDFGGLLRGRVVIGALPTVAPYLLPGWLREFGARHAGIDVVVHEDTTAQLTEALISKEIDLAVISLPVVRAGVAAVELFAETLLVAVPAGHALAAKPALTLAELEGEPFILMKEGHCLARQTLQFCQMRGFAPRVSFRSAQIETVLAFVAAGTGVSIVPAMACRRPVPGVAFRELAGVEARRTIGLIHRQSRPLSRAARTLVEFLQAQVATATTARLLAGAEFGAAPAAPSAGS